MGISITRLRLASVAVVSASALALSACGSDDPVDTGGNGDGNGNGAPSAVEGLSGSIAGAGASSQESAQKAWMASFQSVNADVTLAYDPVGSGGGVEQFLQGASDFGGTDAALTTEELEQSKEVCGPGGAIDIPLYISPIAVIFNLEGVDSLNMSPATIAGIFDQKITKWNDPAIVEENPDADLPDLDINPVNRSDESGTTENFLEYLTATAGDAWPHEVSGDWPVGGGQSAQGTSGVVQTVSGGNGTIGYADASQAGDLGTVAVKVGEEYVPYSPEGAAKVVDASPELKNRPEHDVAFELDRNTTEAGAYPVVLVSYMMACTTYEDATKADIVKAYLSYIASADGQQVAADNAGAAPISDTLRQQVQASIDAINAG